MNHGKQVTMAGALVCVLVLCTTVAPAQQGSTTQGAGAAAQATVGAGTQTPRTGEAQGQGNSLTPDQGRPQQGQPGAPTNGDGAPNNPSTPAPPPPGRPKIGLALGGGGALALSEIGVLKWMEENHVPVDVIAGTSMGSLLGALFATGHSVKQMEDLTRDEVFSKVFRIGADFRELNFRRREDQRFLPGGINMGLKKGVSLRNGVLLDYGLNQFLNAQFLPYGAEFSFDEMPLPFRCVATDILVGREAVFAHGPLAEAVRASISIPGVFPPLEDGGHIYVDGALTENLPTDIVKRELHADVVLAVSLPLTPPGQGDTGSVLGILQRSFSVASWSNEVRSRALADVIIEPIAPPGVGAGDYAKSADLAKVGYEAAQKMAPQLLKYALNDTDWAQYQQTRTKREASPLRNIAKVTVIAPNGHSAIGVRDTANNLPGKKLNTDAIEAKLNEVRSDGRFETDYFLTTPGQVVNTDVTGPANEGRKVQGRELLHPEERRGPGDDTVAKLVADADKGVNTGQTGSAVSATPVNNSIPPGKRGAEPAKEKQTFETVAPSSRGRIALATAEQPGYKPGEGDVDLNLWVRDRPGGPPYLLLGGNVVAQTGGTARATLDGVLTMQDFGGFKSEFRTKMRFGYLTQLSPEYYKRFGDTQWFAMPHLDLLRTPVYIWGNQQKIAERMSLSEGGGMDVGYIFSHFSELRAGYAINHQIWHTTTGSDGLPNFEGNAQNARVQFRFNGQDRAMVPRHGLRVDASGGYQFQATRSENAPRVEGTMTYFRDIGHGNTLSFSFEGGSMFHRNVADPFRFTLGGPLRLTASAYDEYRGTDFLLARPAYFRRLAELPQPLGQSIYVIGTYELGRIYSPGGGAGVGNVTNYKVPTTVMRQDVFLGLAAETPFGAITFGPAFGTDGHRKLVFTLGRFF